ncbi:uncharacterized protein isoform X2 [Rhodnius prolixus]|uniref:uncharacterized protein isoform X2 n=1 Tax=Rhodnius prolixus TaxID=13249 RepID=UPI003D18FB45
MEARDLLNSVNIHDRLHGTKLGALPDDEDTEDLISSQYINLNRLPENLHKVHLVNEQLTQEILSNHHVVELATSNDFNHANPTHHQHHQSHDSTTNPNVQAAAGSVQTANTTDNFYDDEEELLGNDLTEEDKRLAAALVAVQLVHQQKQQFPTDLLNTKTISTLSPLPSVNIEKPSVAAMVSSYFQAFEDENAQLYQTTPPAAAPIQEMRLPPLKKVLSTQLIRNRYDKPLLVSVDNPEDQKDLITKNNSCKIRKNDIICDTSIRDCSDQEFLNDIEPDIECESDLKSSRRSLPHKKRIPRKLKTQPLVNCGSISRMPIHQHTLSKGYKCLKCGDTFISQSALLSHRASHIGGNVVAPVSGSVADSAVAPGSGGLDANLVASIQDDPNAGNVTGQNINCGLKKCGNSLSAGFSCELCGVTSIDQIKFFEHLKAHYEPNIIQVNINEQHILEYSTGAVGQSIVQETFSVKPDSMQVLKLEAEPTLNCNQCGRIFRRKKALESHLATAHPTIEEFSEPEDMMEGIRHVVNIQTASPDEEPDTKLRSWRLSDDLNLDDDDILDDVKEESSGNFNKDLDEKGKKRKKTVQCPHCTRTFTHRNSLLYHIRSHSGRRPHQCDVCGKGFFAANALRVHMRMHSGDKPYKCDVCLRNFRQWGDLKYHITSLHSTTRQFQCEFCGKDFARKYSLIVHRRIHTGEKNYVCEYCRKTFRASSYLVNHRRIHTGEKPHNCDICHKPFRVKSDMKRHRNTHNKDRTMTHNNPSATNATNIANSIVENVDSSNSNNHSSSNSSNNSNSSNSVADQIQEQVDSSLLATAQIPLNLNMRQDVDPLNTELDRDPNTLYVWLPSATDSILPD